MNGAVLTALLIFQYHFCHTEVAWASCPLWFSFRLCRWHWRTDGFVHRSQHPDSLRNTGLYLWGTVMCKSTCFKQSQRDQTELWHDNNNAPINSLKSVKTGSSYFHYSLMPPLFVWISHSNHKVYFLKWSMLFALVHIDVLPRYNHMKIDRPAV